MEKQTHVKTRNDFRKWLEKNHEKENKVLVIKHKRHTKKPAPTHKECMEEAICFGWIDTTVKRIDEDRYANYFVKRTDKSRWSNNTLRYARELIEKGLMTPTGMKRYEEGLKKPVIDHGLPKNPDIPKDLRKELGRNKKALENFEKFAPSYRRIFIYWIESAKMKETRDKRIAKVVEKAKRNDKMFL
jgi:uncharacterized protein YdeI (YjbR/CyaY-like superfamily)